MTARLRRTFHYPADSDDDDAVEEGMDEQDQETLLTSLSTHDTTSTTLYTRLLLLLPLGPIPLYLVRLTTFSSLIPSLVAIASLLASAYTLYFLPLPPAPPGSSTLSLSTSNSKAKGKSIARDPTTGTKSTPTTNIFSSPHSRPVPYLAPTTADLLRKYIIALNAAICALLALVELFQRRPWSEGMMVGGGYVPLFVLVFILWARRELRAVDLGELERLRYKGRSSVGG